MASGSDGEDYENTPNLKSTFSAGLIVFLSALNIFLSITSSLGNALTLLALRNVPSVHPPTKLLLRCLAVTDLCVCLISQPLFAILLLNAVTEINVNVFSCTLQANPASSFILSGLSIFTSTAVSVDRLLALVLGLRYREVATVRRMFATICCFWLICVSGGLMYSFWSKLVAYCAVTVFGMLCLFISIFSYKKIFLTLRQRHVQVNVQNEHGLAMVRRGIPLNIERYKKTVSSIVWVQLAMVVCYVPFLISVVLRAMIGWRDTMTADVVWICATTLLYSNSSVNPILFCWKIKDVRRAMKSTIRRLFCLQYCS